MMKSKSSKNLKQIDSRYWKEWKKKSAERLLAAKDHKEAKLAEKESKSLEVKPKMMDIFNLLLVKDVGLMNDDEKADHVATLKYLKKSIFPDMY